MATNQYHEPVEKLDTVTQDFARIMQSLIEEAEAIHWYHQRIKATKNEEVAEIMKHAQEEEFEHFAMNLEWASRQIPEFREILKNILFKDGDIVENAKMAE